MQSAPEPYHSLESATSLVVILGPTAVGKTELALDLAERLNGEIISADSRLFYRGMDIGTAKPSKIELERVPHHLINITNPDDVISLARFQRLANGAIANAARRGRLPFLVGGTGQYIHAVIQGWSVPRVQPDPALRSALETWSGQIGADGLHQRLSVLDPQAAEVIDYRNLRRTIRALEVILSTGEKFSTQRRRSHPPYRALQIGLTRPRAELFARIDERVEAMISAGLVQEVRSLLENGYRSDLPPFSAIGYREIISHLKGMTSLEEAIVQIKRASRVLVRRQANWFKNSDPNINWFEAGPDTAAQIMLVITKWLKQQDKP